MFSDVMLTYVDECEQKINEMINEKINQIIIQIINYIINEIHNRSRFAQEKFTLPTNP